MTLTTSATRHDIVRLNLGSGADTRRPGSINVDCRNIPGCVDIQADVLRLPFADRSFDEIIAESVFEHLDDPRQAIAECARLMRDTGTLIVRVPSLGTCAAHLDPTHRYLADLKHWIDLLGERFGVVKVSSVGVRWRASPTLVFVQRFCISILGWHDLGQCWILTAKRPRQEFVPLVAQRWWLDD
jgi:SAM-dependent methyltransferase